MASPAQPDGLDARVRTMQILVGAILLGGVAFLGYAAWERSRAPAPEGQGLTFTYVMLGVGLVLAVAYYFVTDAVAAAQRRRIAGASAAGSATAGVQALWVGAYQTTLLAGVAILEAAALLLTFAYLREGNWRGGNWVSLAAAIGFLAILVTNFPTRPGVERWIAEQQERLKQEQGRR